MKPYLFFNSTKWKRFVRSPNLVGWLLCTPALVVLGVFFLAPVIVGLRTSFYEWNGASINMKFIGLSNYIEALNTPRFWNAMLTNWLAMFGTLITQMPPALFLAIGLSKQTPLMKVYRGAIFCPQVLSIAAAGLLWTLIYNPYQGPFNQLLSSIGLDFLALGWLGEPSTALISLIIASGWFYFGFHMIIFMAGLAAIPKEYFEAALLETNNWFATIRYVTLPLLREQFLISFVLIFGGSFGSLMGFFYLMTSGGPSGSTELLGIYMTIQAFRANRYGYASAISMIILLIVGVVLIGPVIHIARERLEY